MKSGSAIFGILCAGCALLLLCMASAVSAREFTPTAVSPQEQQLLSAWQSTGILPADVPTAVFIAEGASDTALAQYTAQLHSIYSDIDSTTSGITDIYKRAHLLFDRLHTTTLRTYRDNASLRNTLDSGVYNCASAMALFYGAAIHCKLPVALYATPAHVFATLTIGNRTVRIEITRPESGFDFGDNIPEIIDHLVRYNYVAREDVEKRGEEEIFRTFFVASNRLSEAQFLAITYNNIGVQHWLDRKYIATMEAFEKAILLHPDSRKYRDAYQAALSLVLQQYEAGDNPDDIGHLLNRSALLMHNDTLFIYYLLGAAGSVIAKYGSDEAGLYRSRAFLDTLAHIVPHDSTVDAVLGEQQSIVDYNLAVYDFNRGDYEGAYRSASTLPETDTTTRELLVKSASYSALALAGRERAAEAYALLDSLIPRYHQHPLFRDTYRKVTIDYVLQSGLVKRNGATAAELMKARDLLLNVYDVDSTNIYLRSIVAAVHHELGMIELRARHYTAAAEILRIGLLYDPENDYIKESIRLVEQQTSPATNKSSVRP